MEKEPPKKPSLWSWFLFGQGPGPGEPSHEWAYANAEPGVEKAKRAVKCDMCSGIEGGPSCVRACPTGAAIRVGIMALAADGVPAVFSAGVTETVATAAQRTGVVETVSPLQIESVVAFAKRRQLLGGCLLWCVDDVGHAPTILAGLAGPCRCP